MRKIKKKVKNEYAFTLIEVLVSVTIISIIAISIMPLLTEGIKTIYNASKNTQNLFNSEGEMQYKLADKIVFKEVEVPIKFENKSDVNNIKGGLVESEGLYSFIASIPTIKINPSILVEGYRPQTIEIVGNNTHFNENETNFEIVTKDNNLISDYSYTINSENSISLNLEEGLSNSLSEYTIKITTDRDIGLEEIEPEIARTKLQINPPNFIAGGNNGQILVSKDGEYWTSKNSPTTNEFSDSLRVNNQYIFSTNNGEIYSLVDDQGWKEILLDLESINSLLKEEKDNQSRIWAIGKKGISYNHPIYVSKNGVNWEKFDLIDSSQENIPDEFSTAEISNNNDEIFFAGEDTILKYHINNDSITNIDLSSELEETIDSKDLTINDISYANNNFIFIGYNNDNNRIILRYDNENNDWYLIQNNSQATLNSVYWSEEYEKFIAAGNNGTLLSSDDGITWNEESSSLIDNNIDLLNVITFTYDNKPLFLLSGKNAYNSFLYYSNNENNFTDINKVQGISGFDSILSFSNRF